jgi:hypothetical protein
MSHGSHGLARVLSYFYLTHGPLFEVEDGTRIYHDVYAFTDNVRVKARVIEPAIIRARLHECLIGRADTWYREKLDRLMRLGLKVDLNGVEEWCKILETQFGDPISQSLYRFEPLYQPTGHRETHQGYSLEVRDKMLSFLHGIQERFERFANETSDRHDDDSEEQMPQPLDNTDQTTTNGDSIKPSNEETFVEINPELISIDFSKPCDKEPCFEAGPTRRTHFCQSP